MKQSDSDADHWQESMVASSGPSRDTEGFTEVPKDVKALEPVIAMLIDKVGRKASLFALLTMCRTLPRVLLLNGAQRQERWLYHFTSMK